MKRFALVVCALMLAAPVFSAADITGKWSGKFIITGPDGQPKDDTIYMDLTQKGTVLTGKAGPSAEEQFPLQNGKVEGTKVTFEVVTPGPLMAFTLALVDGHLKGECQAEFGGEKRKAVVDAQRKTY